MVKPNKSQSDLLEKLRFLVIDIMIDMDIWQDYDLQPHIYSVIAVVS